MQIYIHTHLPRVRILTASAPPKWAPDSCTARSLLSAGIAKDHVQLKQKVWRAKTLLRCAQALLLSEHPAKFGNDEAVMADDDMDMDNRGTDEPQASANHTAGRPPVSSYKKVVLAASRALQCVANLLGEFGDHFPPELFVALFVLRGYVCEREGDVDACYLHLGRAWKVSILRSRSPTPSASNPTWTFQSSSLLGLAWFLVWTSGLEPRRELQLKVQVGMLRSPKILKRQSLNNNSGLDWSGGKVCKGNGLGPQTRKPQK